MMRAFATDIADQRKGKRMSFSEQIERIMNLSITPEGEVNETSPFAFTAALNRNILNHKDAMKAIDKEQFLEAMEEEIDHMISEEIFEEVDISEVPSTHSILGSVWSHRRKITPTGEIYIDIDHAYV